ncbi:Uncharacterised protein [Acinetobacter baumannii]|nr:Uncharacterised protein [Acinetobacter baumannii]
MNKQILAQNSICAISPVCVFIAYPQERIFYESDSSAIHQTV